MSDYVPLYSAGDEITRVASATITGGQLVRVSGNGTVAPVSAASADWLGVAAFDCASGDNVTVYLGQVQRPLASGTVTAGQTVEGAAGGAVATHTNGTNDVYIVGLALSTATTGLPVSIRFVR